MNTIIDSADLDIENVHELDDESGFTIEEVLDNNFDEFMTNALDGHASIKDVFFAGIMTTLAILLEIVEVSQEDGDDSLEILVNTLSLMEETVINKVIDGDINLNFMDLDVCSGNFVYSEDDDDLGIDEEDEE